VVLSLSTPGVPLQLVASYPPLAKGKPVSIDPTEIKSLILLLIGGFLGAAGQDLWSWCRNRIKRS
jgi:hypothetical protein